EVCLLECVHRPRRGRVRRPEAIGELADPERAVIDDGCEREPLHRRQLPRLEPAEAAALTEQEREQPLDLGSQRGRFPPGASLEPGGRSSAHSAGSIAGTSFSRGRRRSTRIATPAPARPSSAHSQKASAKPETAGTDVPGIVCAVSSAAPTWPPTTPPTV